LERVAFEGEEARLVPVDQATDLAIGEDRAREKVTRGRLRSGALVRSGRLQKLDGCRRRQRNLEDATPERLEDSHVSRNADGGTLSPNLHPEPSAVERRGPRG